jgi:hypothetical protein
VRVLDVLVILAVLVAVVRLPIQEGDDERVFEPDLYCVRAFVHLAGAGNQVISEQRVAARAVDQDVSRLQHRHRVLRRHDGHGALHPIRPARIDQIAEGMLDRVERAEPQRPVLQECTEVRRNGPSEREFLVELQWIEDCPDAVSVDGIVFVALDRIRHEVRCELDHARSRVLAPLLIEAHGEPLHRLKQCREKETYGPGADDVYGNVILVGLSNADR